MVRYISIHPKNQYTFRQNADYRERWNFLPDQERVSIIAAQLTYLEFHEWLDKNLRYHKEPDPRASNPLEFDVKEGFVRTDVLLYGAICEAALYVVAKEVFNSKTASKPADLLAAFQTSEKKIEHLGNQTFTSKANGETVKIGYYHTKVTPKSDSTINFVRLIKAAKSIGAIKPDLAAKLDQLREDRNTIHLGAQIARRQAKLGGRFDGPDRETAKEVTEEMRRQLDSYYKRKA